MTFEKLKDICTSTDRVGTTILREDVFVYHSVPNIYFKRFEKGQTVTESEKCLLDVYIEWGFAYRKR